MSVTLTLTSAAIIAGISMSTAASLAALSQLEDHSFNKNEGLQTVFMDSDILIQTLNDYDCHFDVVSENEIIVRTNCGNLKYARGNVTESFKMYVGEIEDVDGLMENIRSFEVDYGRNVQAYTYNHIKSNLSKGMTIVEEEVLEDDSLLLTINVE